jgi:threonine synthase
MAHSTAAYGVKAGLKTFVLVKDDISQEKLLATAVHKPTLIAVKGDYGDLFRQSFAVGQEHSIYFMNSFDPMRIEGYKIPSFEIFAQLDFRVPDYVFVPVSSGGHLIGLMRGFLDLRTQGLCKDLPVFIGVQARGCSPIASAFALGEKKVERIEKPNTIAHAISNPDPPGGQIVLKMIQDFQGMIIDVPDQEILEAQRILAESEGLFCMPASATTLAGLLKLAKKRKFRPSDKIVLVITGSGVKALDALESSKINVRHTGLSDLEKQIKSLI